MKADRVFLPAGENLIAHSNPDNPSGVLTIPTPFESDEALTLHWEKISTFENDDEDFIHTWGKHQRGDRKGVISLGRFFLGDDELERTPMSQNVAEYFRYCRFDDLGCDYEWRNEDFDGQHGFDCSPLMQHVPKKTGQFNASTPTTEILSIRFGNRGAYKLTWKKGNEPSRWTLEVDWNRQTSNQDGSITACVNTEYEFDFEKKICAFKQNYAPCLL